MDSSQPFSGKRYILVDNELADMIEEINPGDLRLLLRCLLTASRCYWGSPRGSQITITAPDGTRSHLVGDSETNREGLSDLLHVTSGVK